jgi:hypothetical protein
LALFADDIKIGLYHNIMDVDNCKLFQNDFNSVHNLSLFNGMKFNLDKTTIISLTRKKQYYFNNKLCNNLVTRCQCAKHLGVL